MQYRKCFSLSLLLMAMLVVAANAQPIGRTFGVRRLTLDNNDGNVANNVFFVDLSGSLGIDNVGAFNGTYPNTSALLTLLAGTKTTNLRIDGGATWGIDVVNTNNSIRTSGRSIFGDNVGVDDATFQIGTGSVSITGGAGRTDNLFIVNGLADATVASLAANTVWDSRINGDQLVTGIQKIGGSIWLDGNSAIHQIVTDAPINLGTKNANTTALITNNLQRLFIDAAGNTTITGNLILTGISAPPLPAPLIRVLYLNPTNQVTQTPTTADIVTGSGTLNTIPMWTPDNFKIGNSIMTQTSNTGISITPGVATTNNVQIVNGVADATIANVAADAVWDSRINGDQLVTGIQKIGGSIWLDGNSATHQIVTDAPVNIGTKNANTASLITNNSQRLAIDGSGNATMTGNAFGATYPAGFNFTSAGSSNGNFVASFTNPNSGNGISIQVGAGTPDGSNNLLEFRNSGGTVIGRIEGQTLSELHASADWIEAIRVYDANITLSSLNAAVSAAGVIVGAALAADAADPLCDVACPGSVAAGVAAIALGVAQTALSTAQAIEVGVEKSNYISNQESGVGVTYQSGAGDYAEWLPKMEMNEKFAAGNIVAIKGGVITKNTEGATQLMVISRKPIVLGNTPELGKEAKYERVAFMGQVPVIVLGKVNRGDYILPSGGNNGMGIAVSPDKMGPTDYKQVVGVAWSSSKNDAVNEINVAVGINSLATSTEMERQNNTIRAQEEEIRSLKSSIGQTNQILAKLVPGFKEAAAVSITENAAPATVATIALKNEEQTIPGVAKPVNAKFCTKEFVEVEFAKARKNLAEKGIDLSTNPFYIQFDTNPAFKESAIAMITDKLNQAFLKQAELRAAKQNNSAQD
ncbi:MAG: hypothetical protein Q8919_14070 [Bacteroidota bacterium]|nr:hypothetical protein [Bacteroidota bacterium]